MDILQRASDLLTPFMAEERRDTWLTLAFRGEYPDVYSALPKTGAASDFTVACVRRLLDHGHLGSRHALSLLLDTVRSQAGTEKQPVFLALIHDLDASFEQPAEASCPYRDLRAFREQDAPFYFGRDAFSAELVTAVGAHPFVAVIGPSGSGKSSVVQAGLIPKLRSHGGWEVGILRPGPEPWRSLADCLLELLEGEPGASEELQRLERISELAEDFETAEPDGGKVKLEHIVERILAKRPGIGRLLLVVDQWEELYTNKETDPVAAASFADRLMAAALNARLTVVLTLRADFTSRAIEHRPLRDRLQEATVFLGGMTLDEREQAITGPAGRAGVEFEPGLVGRILEDVGDEPGNLPLLEFCLTQLYARRQDGPMCQAAYEAIGGVKGAIVQRADGVVDQLSAGEPARANLARDVFLQLVQLGEGTEDTRRRAALADFDEPARAVIWNLADARLVVTGRDPGSGQETVEVAHESLIRRWPRLREWLCEDRDDLHVLREIERAAAGWAAHGEAYRWPDERIILEAAPALRRLASRFPLSELGRSFVGPVEPEAMLAALEDRATSHALRARIGDRLALLPGGDTRPGVGLRADGLPDIAWHAVPGGEVELEIAATGLLSRLRGRPRMYVEPFHLARYPVTVAQWGPFLEAEDGYDALVRRMHGWEPGPQTGRPNQPAINVTWIEALAYCRWLGSRLGCEIRLPTEWQWEQAASGGDRANDYPWGKWQDLLANTRESELGRVTAVGLYLQGASAQGLMDLAGNVWEWCLNKFDSPKDNAIEGNVRRVVRGGSWYDLRDYARCAYRLAHVPDLRNLNLGFRVVCVSPIR